MPSNTVTANSTAQTIAAERENARCNLKSITIDALNAAADRQINVQDVFTPAVTNGQASPSETTVNRFYMNVLKGDQITLGEDEVKGIRCLGAMKVISDVTDANILITCGYEFDD